MNFDNVYITSDIHLSHVRIMKYCDRPFKDIEEMNEYILKQFDELPKNSLIINNGDLFLNSRMEYEKLKWYVQRMKKNNKKLWIILGNHDKSSWQFCKNCPFKDPYDMYIDLGFDRVFPFPILLEDKYLLSHEPIYLKPGSNLINVYAHTHNIDVDPDYYNRDCENWAMMEVVKKHAELGTKQTNLDIDTSIKPYNKKIDLVNYFNVCWDKHHKILKWSDIFK